MLLHDEISESLVKLWAEILPIFQEQTEKL